MTKILALHDSHSASICEIENNKIIYFQEAERLNRKKKSGDWLILLDKYNNKSFDTVIFAVTSRNDREKNIKYWRIGQWCTTGFLWYTWLSHDLANIAVFLPRSVPVEWMLAASGIFIVFLGYMFYEKGGRIQKIVLEKTGTRYVRSATIIDLVYAFILLFFKQYNDIPMSTTWVFVGLLCGRELAISTIMQDYKFKYVFPIIAKDFIKMLVGLLVSIGIVLIIHYVIVPNGL